MAATNLNPPTYRDGDAVQCQNCGKPARVKYFNKGGVVVLTPTEKIELALRCQSCGTVMCDECAHGGTTAAPVCPVCKREWGPYYFIRDAPPPGSGFNGLSGVGSPFVNQPPANVPESPGQPSAWSKALEQTPQTGFLPVSQATPVIEEDEAPAPRKKIPIKPLLIALLVVGLLGGSITLGVRYGPRLVVAFRQARPTPTSTPLAVTGPLTELASYVGQNLSLDGHIQLPPEDCSALTADPAWCRVKVRPLSGGSAVLAVLQFGQPTNAMTPDHRLLSWSGKLVTEGAPVRLSGKVACPDTGECEVQVERIEALQVKLTATSTLTPTAAPTLTPTPPGCTSALSVTLDYVGETLCVEGVVLRTSQQGNAFLIWFSNEKNTFYLVLYDRTWNEAQPGACVRATGEIKRLGNAPVIAPLYKDPLDLCP